MKDKILKSFDDRNDRMELRADNAVKPPVFVIVVPVAEGGVIATGRVPVTVTPVASYRLLPKAPPAIAGIDIAFATRPALAECGC